MRKIILFVVCFTVLAGFLGSAFGEFAKPEDAIELRKSAMTLIAYQFKKIAAVIKGEQPYDSAGFVADTEAFKMLSDLSWDAFIVPESDKGHTTLNAKALKDPKAFKAEAEELMTAASHLVKAAKSGDLKAAKAPFGEAAKSCKDCHKKYRK
ncbi:MAG: cytochrome c [Desulfobacteraceae bacterium]